MEEYIKTNYPDTLAAEIAKNLNISVQKVYRIARKLGVKKSKEFLESPQSGRLTPGHARAMNTRFKKGQPAHNKGKPITDKQRQALSHTFFPKGHTPHNTKKDGAISIRNGLKWIRITKRVWEPLHREIWKEKNGPIPKGMIVTFIDRNTANCSISNLELITRGENMKRNSIIRYPKDIQNAIKAQKRLERKIEKSQKSQKS